MKTLSERYQQANKEAKWAVCLALAYFVWWYVSAYLIFPDPPKETLPELYFGFPLWFLFACVIGPVVFTLLCALMIKYLYQDMSFDIDEENHEQ
ncbi:hypothetical protein GCM10007938_27850 [Vibrio zhanjiangensis]|uniref:DUF997 family protein n=1 Tax=Vibrio zhanjiangensis TaxID=1046128 RepID=A0ABQ6F0I8_9VIBR|nr:YhdT family protein [Vibrio zhanjiangensis]GLT19003.1 hypothetical protein GCM10007938_27850 [Vibrio zhanjiangensis]